MTEPLSKEHQKLFDELKLYRRPISIAYNIVVDKIGITSIANMMKNKGIIGTQDCPLICPGSGDGVTVRALCEKIGTELKDVVCIDPAPYSYSGTERSKKLGGISPSYRCVPYYVLSNRRSVGHVNLLLDWPTDSSRDGRYDFYAILDLFPRKICILFDTLGGSGSDWLISWIKRIPGIEEYGLQFNEDNEVPIDLFAKLPKYKCIGCISKIITQREFYETVPEHLEKYMNSCLSLTCLILQRI